MKLWVGVIALLTLLAGCDAPNTRLDPAKIGIAGDQSDQAVDGLIVGHRLMEAGEYELALKAYARAAGAHGLNADVLSSMGAANLKLGRLNQAETLLRRAVEKDPDSVPAWNNLGVILMETGRTGEARAVFRNAFALDNGNSDEIRENLRLAIAKTEKTGYDEPKKNRFELVRRGKGRFLLLNTPDANEEQ